MHVPDYSVSRSIESKRTGKSGKNCQTQLVLMIRTTTTYLRLVQQFALWSFSYWSSVIMSIGGYCWSSSKISAAMFSCTILPCLKRGCNWPFMGADNNDNNIWNVSITLLWTAWCVWVQPTKLLYRACVDMWVLNSNDKLVRPCLNALETLNNQLMLDVVLYFSFTAHL